MKRSPLKFIYGMLAFLFFGIGAVGVVLPILPTTPFLLLAGFFFAKSSEKFHQWFLQTKIYKKHLESFVNSRSMTLKTKLCILIPVTIMLSVPFLIMDNIPGKVCIVVLVGVKYTYFFTKIKTIKPEGEKLHPLESRTQND